MFGKGLGATVGVLVGENDGDRVGVVVGAGDVVGTEVGDMDHVPHSIPHAHGQALIRSCTCCSLKPMKCISRQSNWEWSLQGALRRDWKKSSS